MSRAWGWKVQYWRSRQGCQTMKIRKFRTSEDARRFVRTLEDDSKGRDPWRHVTWICGSLITRRLDEPKAKGPTRRQRLK